ncbi:hypothetical protein Tsubulata_002856 [Turnera subulata]|uniref:Uncharacterized protein n=1 Tax=Turnera subulata TaxID=218843 RepID=A0A9Q0J3S0_9ROSI|nr:hypothetical protein Tsubulata_002856 [Turnera subulata]
MRGSRRRKSGAGRPSKDFCGAEAPAGLVGLVLPVGGVDSSGTRRGSGGLDEAAEVGDRSTLGSMASGLSTCLRNGKDCIVLILASQRVGQDPKVLEKW